MAIVFRKAEKRPSMTERLALVDMIKQLLKADKAYYNGDKPIMSDAAYDALRERAYKAHKDTNNRKEMHKGKIDANAYFKRVGAPVRASKRSAKLPVQLGSLKKVKSDDAKALNRFFANASAAAIDHGRYCASLGKDYAGVASIWLRGGVTVLTSPKLDGLTLLLHYHKGTLTNAFTRGDGENAQSKMEHALALVALGRIPMTLPKSAFHKFAKADLYTKGEVVCRLKAFKAKWQGKGYTNARNAAAGWLNSDKAKHPIHNAIDFIAYDVFTTTGELGIEDEPPSTNAGPAADKHHTLTCLKKAGFKTYLSSGFFSVDHFPSGAPSANWKAILEEKLLHLNDSPYQLDGLVIEVNNNYIRGKMGSKDGRPKFAIAYKTSADDLENNEGADSEITKIEYNTSKVGALKPMIHYKPVRVMDSTLAKATGNNVSYLIREGLGVGAKVRVVKAGGIIPKVHLIGPKMKADKIVPTHCECGAPAVPVKKGSKMMPDYYCSKPSKCKVIQRELLGASIKQLGIVGLAGKTIDKLFDAGFTSLTSLLSADAKKIAKIPGFGQAMVTAIKVALPAALKKCSTYEVMDMSGVFMQPGLSLGTSSLVKLEKVIGKNMTITPKDKKRIVKAIGPAKGQLFIDKYPEWCEYKSKLISKIPLR